MTDIGSPKSGHRRIRGDDEDRVLREGGALCGRNDIGARTSRDHGES